MSDLTSIYSRPSLRACDQTESASDELIRVGLQQRYSALTEQLPLSGPPPEDVSNTPGYAADRTCQGQVHFNVQDDCLTMHGSSILERLLVRSKAFCLPFEGLSAEASFL